PAASEPAAARRFLGEQIDGSVEPDREDLLDVGKVGIGSVVKDERAIATDAGSDEFPRLGVITHWAGQGEQLERALQRQRVRRPPPGQACALGFLALAELDVGPETAALEQHILSALRIDTEDTVADGFGRRAGRRVGKLHRMAAFWIIRAADEGAELAELER